MTETTPESGTLPGRFEFVREPSLMEVPTDPEWQRPSDVVRSFSAGAGATYGRQDNVGDVDAVDHHRGAEDPSLEIGYDLQRFPIDSDGNALDPSGDGILRNSYNQLINTQLWIEQQDVPGGNFGTGVRVFTVARGVKVESVQPTLDPSEEAPILMELTTRPRKVRSYKVHQPDEAVTLDIESTEDGDTMDITIEDLDAETTETVSLTGTTSVQTTEEFGDVYAVWLDEAPDGNVTVSGGDDTVVELIGGLEYSEDDQPIDGDRGIPATNGGSRSTEINEPYEFFLGDRFERPDDQPVRTRVNSASWSVENDFEDNTVHDTRAPVVDEGNRTVQVEADTAGPFVSHESMMESLRKVQHDLVHELTGGEVRFKSTTPTGAAERTREAEQAVASYSETFEASGNPAIELTHTDDL